METGKIKVKVEVDTSELDEALEKMRELKNLSDLEYRGIELDIRTMGEVKSDKEKLIDFLEENLSRTLYSPARKSFKQTLDFIENNL